MSADRPKWDPAVDGIAELVEHRRMVKELRALATGWEKEAKAWHSAALREDAGHEHAAAVQCRGRARGLEDHATALFAIVGRE